MRPPQEIESRIKQIIGRAAMRSADGIAPEASLSSLGMESLEQIECVLAIEESFRVEIRDADLWRLRTVQDVIDAVKSATAAQAAEGA